MVKSKRYENGLRLVVDTIDNLFSVAISINVMVGSSNEDEFSNGISHYIEHMLFKGTKNRTAYEISEEMESIGADFNAFTSKENTSYYVKCTNEHSRKAMDVLSDMFFNATFSDEEGKKEKGVILEEINMSHDTPDDFCSDLVARAYYGNRNFGYEILGTKENVIRFNKEDIKKHLESYYTADNVVISVCGNISFEEAEKLTDEYFAKKFKTASRTAEKCVMPIYCKDNLHAVKHIEQSHVELRFPSLKYGDEMLETYSIADSVLGGGMTSRLFQKIREEKGLCYTVYSFVSSYYSHGISDVYVGVNPKKRDEAVKCIMEEINNLKENGVTEKEFLRAKEQYKSSIVFAQESTVKLMRIFGRYMLNKGGIYDAKKLIDKINGITLEEVNSALKNMYDFNRMATATVGPEDRPLDI